MYCLYIVTITENVVGGKRVPCNRDKFRAFVQQYVKPKSFQIYKLGFKEAEETEVKLPVFTGSQRKQRSSRKCLFLPH